MKRNDRVVQTLVTDWNKMSCNSWTVLKALLQLWHKTATLSEDVTEHQRVLFLPQWPMACIGRVYSCSAWHWTDPPSPPGTAQRETPWVSVSIVCLTPEDKKLQYMQRERHLSPLWVRMCERNITVVKKKGKGGPIWSRHSLKVPHLAPHTPTNNSHQ